MSLLVHLQIKQLFSSNNHCELFASLNLSISQRTTDSNIEIFCNLVLHFSYLCAFLISWSPNLHRWTIVIFKVQKHSAFWCYLTLSNDFRHHLWEIVAIVHIYTMIFDVLMNFVQRPTRNLQRKYSLHHLVKFIKK